MPSDKKNQEIVDSSYVKRWLYPFFFYLDIGISVSILIYILLCLSVENLCIVSKYHLH